MPTDVLGFVAMSFAVIATPGPAVAHVVLSGVLGGRKLASFAIGGILGGHCVAIATSFTLAHMVLGQSGILAYAQWLAAAVLAFLGLRLLICAFWPGTRGTNRALWVRGRGEGRLGAALTGSLLTLLNPTSLAFFVSAALGFLDPTEPLWPQGGILGLLYLCTAAIVHGTYALLASRMHGRAIGSVEQAQRLLRIISSLVTLATAAFVAARAAGVA